MRPIGYWLKHLDALIEADFAALLSDEQLDRRTWQVLNTLHTKPHTAADLATAMAPFTATEARRSLTERGWITETDDTLSLTPEGTHAYTDISARVHTRRHHITRGITDEEYTATINVLERMATNLTTPPPA